MAADDALSSDNPWVVIANPQAGTAGLLEEVREEITRLTPRVEIRLTEAKGHATELAREAVAEGTSVVVAAGGDGTIHEVVNGLAPDFARVQLGVIPLGTGNDLCRTLGVDLEPLTAARDLAVGRERLLDLIEVELTSGERFFAVNAVSGGFSGQVSQVLTYEMKAKYGPFAFLIGGVEAAREIVRYETRIVMDDGQLREPDTLGVIAANGRTVAGGFEIAPLAAPDDGVLEVVVLRSEGALDLAAMAARLLAGNLLESDSVRRYPSTRLHVSSSPLMPFNADGELLPAALQEVRVVPAALRVRLGAGSERGSEETTGQK